MARKPKQPSPLEEALGGVVRQMCLTTPLEEPLREYQFHATRKWRFDFYFPAYKLAVEVQGGGWSGGRHGRAAGMTADYHKNAAALLQGIRVLYVTGEMIEDGSAVGYIMTLAGIPPPGHFDTIAV